MTMSSNMVDNNTTTKDSPTSMNGMEKHLVASSMTISRGAQAKRDLHKRRGDDLVQEHNYTQAVKEYTLALSVDPTNTALLQQRSDAYLSTGKNDMALEDLKMLASAFQEKGEWQQAIRVHEKVLETDPNQQEAQRDLQSCQKELEKKQPSNGKVQELQETKKASTPMGQVASPEPDKGSGKTSLEHKLQQEINNFAKSHSNSPKQDHEEIVDSFVKVRAPSPSTNGHAAKPIATQNNTLETSKPQHNNNKVASPPNVVATSLLQAVSAKELVSPKTSETSLVPPKPKPTTLTPENEKNRLVEAMNAAIPAPSLQESPKPPPSAPTTKALTTKPEDTKPAATLQDTKPPALPVLHSTDRTTQSAFVLQTPPQTPPRTFAATSPGAKHGGLSELSKQLRLLQTKNTSQANEIDRLERQLKIIAELKGVNVHDLRRALLAACESEAHAEMRNQLEILKAQLEASALKNSNKTKSSFEKEASDKAMANLQLRVGELEEIVDTLRGENRGLYQSLSEEKEKSTKLQHVCDLQKKQLDDLLQEALVVKEQEAAHCQWSVAPPPVPVLSPPAQEAPEEKQRREKELQEAKLQAQLEKDRADLLQQQTDAREKEAQLRNDQFKSRFQVQDQRIFDLEQQLKSLYAAFEMVQQEHDGEKEQRNVLSSNLYEADSQVARQLTKMESGRDVYASAPADAYATPQTTKSTVTHHYPAKTPPSAATTVTYSSTPQKHSTPQQRQYRDKSPVVAASIDALESKNIFSGFLFKREKNLLKGAWKRRYCVLHGSKGVYHLSYSDAPKQKIKGTIRFIKTGLSTVEPAHNPKQAFVFVLRSNPNNSQAPVFYGAAPSREEYTQWLSALTFVTTGKDNTVSNVARTPQEQEAADHEIALRMQMQYME